MSLRPCAMVTMLATCAGLTGCGARESYSAIALSDQRLAEFSDMHSVKRDFLGLPPLPAAADVEVERSNGSPYDVMLHIYAGRQSRTIAFRRQNGRMKWIHEQVTVYGHRQFNDVDGTHTEHVTLTYETSRVGHFRLNQLNVDYSGPDDSIRAKWDLSLDDVKPLLDQWLGRQ